MYEPSAGELKSPVDFYEHEQDALDFDITNDVKASVYLFSTWCKLSQVGMQSYIESSQISEGVTHRVYLRVSDKINLQFVTKHTLLLVIDGITYKVKRATMLDSRAFILCDVTALYNNISTL